MNFFIFFLNFVNISCIFYNEYYCFNEETATYMRAHLVLSFSEK